MALFALNHTSRSRKLSQDYDEYLERTSRSSIHSSSSDLISPHYGFIENEEKLQQFRTIHRQQYQMLTQQELEDLMHNAHSGPNQPPPLYEDNQHHAANQLNINTTPKLKKQQPTQPNAIAMQQHHHHHHHHHITQQPAIYHFKYPPQANMNVYEAKYYDETDAVNIIQKGKQINSKYIQQI